MKRLLFLGLLALAALLLFGNNGCAPTQTGALRVRVLDGRSDAPLENARVVIPEAGCVRITDETGRTEVMQLPVLRDTRFDAILPQGYGAVTVLAYADGYYPYALFCARIDGNAGRELPVRMLRSDATLEGPFTLVEAPDADWAAALLAQFEPVAE